ncbi:MAG: TolC family protein [Deltaproteobacteria bacterium]
MNRLAAGLLLVAASAHADAPAPGQKLTFEGAIDIALAKNFEVTGAKELVLASEAKSSGQGAKRWVGLNVNANANRWREPYALAFGGMNFTLHEDFTTTTIVSLNQPLTGLAYLTELVDAGEHDTNATRKDYDKTRLDVAYKTADAYLRVLRARASATVAHQSVNDIASELERANQLRQAETYTDIDVLRLKSAKAAADQTALRADSAIAAALSHLTVQIGLPDGAPIDLDDDLPAQPPSLAMTMDQAQQRALSTRPDLASAHEHVAAAKNLRTAAKEKLLPDIRAVAAWQHFSGVQPFQPEDEEYVGLTAQWNVWDWGSTYHAIDEANHAVKRGELGLQALPDLIKAEVRERWLDAKVKFDSLAVAVVQQQTAEEAYRLQKVKLDNAAATTTDVIDAETDVARARLSLADARYDYYLALVALARSVGDLPNPK